MPPASLSAVAVIRPGPMTARGRRAGGCGRCGRGGDRRCVVGGRAARLRVSGARGHGRSRQRKMRGRRFFQASGSTRSMASSIVTMPCRTRSSSTTGRASRLYLAIVWVTSSSLAVGWHGDRVLRHELAHPAAAGHREQVAQREDAQQVLASCRSRRCSRRSRPRAPARAAARSPRAAVSSGGTWANSVVMMPPAEFSG